MFVCACVFVCVCVNIINTDLVKCIHTVIREELLLAVLVLGYHVEGGWWGSTSQDSCLRRKVLPALCYTAQTPHHPPPPPPPPALLLKRRRPTWLVAQ